MQRYRLGLILTAWILIAAHAVATPRTSASMRTILGKKINVPGMYLPSTQESSSSGSSKSSVPTTNKSLEGFRLPHSTCRVLFILSCINPAVAVFKNDYTGVWWPVVNYQRDSTAAFRVIYHGIFSFLRLKPRLLFVVGSCLRALQCTTALERLIDPGVGVGWGLNFLALLSYARWPAPLVLGWAASKSFWVMLGAESPRGGHVPITVHLSDPRKKVAPP